ncbi:hypothetical protein INT48_003319 [Thamnidium elegans]|uniref:Uncharacterized protein n=1 Tax=Thamnidium elegans TaxID=101142 RepID=A0A8H7VXL8_9FUNG|nr:hypothetical protein INT48_003319 [Thamnidium elegans]
MTATSNTIGNLRDILVHALILSEDENWVFIIQIEIYYKDDVDIINKPDNFPKTTFKVIATGDINNGDNKQSGYSHILL